MFCLPDERSPIRQIPKSGYIYLSVICIWLVLVTIGTFLHEVLSQNGKIRIKVQASNHGRKHELGMKNVINKSAILTKEVPSRSLLEDICDAISIRSCIQSFKSNNFSSNYSQGDRVRLDLRTLDFVKCLMTISIVLGHSAFLNSIYSRFIDRKVEGNIGISGKSYFTLTRCVDTFFLLFGLLMSYTIMRKYNMKQLSNPLSWLAINIGVAARIIPVSMLVYWFSKLISPYLGSGPWWDYGVDRNSIKGVCIDEPLWISIPYLGFSGRFMVPGCIPTAWFLVVYLQISLLLPLITYLIWKLPNYAFKATLIAFLLLISTLSVSLKIYNQTSVPGDQFYMYGGFMLNIMQKFEPTGYISALTRLGGVMVGCFTGYLLRMYETGEIQTWPSIMRSKTFFVISMALQVIVFLFPILGNGSKPKLGVVVVANLLATIIWPILNSHLIILATTIYNHRAIVRFFSHSFWRAFSKLGLVIFLVHWEIMFIGLTIHEEAPMQCYNSDIMKLWTFGLIFSVIIAFFVHNLIEAPLARLISVLVYKRYRTQQIETITEDATKIELS